MPKFNVGDRVTYDSDAGEVVYATIPSPVGSYRDCVLVRFDRERRGWVQNGHNRPLVPRDANHLLGVRGLLWVDPLFLIVEEYSDGYDIDA